VAVAILGGVGVSRLARPPVPSPSPTPTPFVRISPTEPPDTGPFVFTQPLSAGCAAGDAVYVVSDGGGIGRFVFDRWQLIDPTARSLSATLCRGDQLPVVADGSSRSTTASRQSDPTRSSSRTSSASPRRGWVLVVGRMGTVERQDANGWGPYAAGIDEDLMRSRPSAPRPLGGRRRRRHVPARVGRLAPGVTATLRAIAARAVDDAVVVGDDATVLIWDGAWKSVAPPVHVGFHAAVRTGVGRSSRATAARSPVEWHPGVRSSARRSRGDLHAPGALHPGTEPGSLARMAAMRACGGSLRRGDLSLGAMRVAAGAGA
jgi:hypothetical protein